MLSTISPSVILGRRPFIQPLLNGKILSSSKCLREVINRENADWNGTELNTKGRIMTIATICLVIRIIINMWENHGQLKSLGNLFVDQQCIPSTYSFSYCYLFISSLTAEYKMWLLFCCGDKLNITSLQTFYTRTVDHNICESTPVMSHPICISQMYCYPQYLTSKKTLKCFPSE